MILEYYVVIIITVVIIIILQNKIIRNMIIKNNHDYENKRMVAMNGIDDMYYISFSHHYKLFNLFKTLTKILNENNIDYIISCGTLLGYCRHNNSFIPWDDDIDLFLVEKDLNKLKQVIKKTFTNNEYYFDEVPGNMYFQFSPLPIDIRTAALNIFIDVFIIDNYKNNSVYTFTNDKVQLYLENEYYNADELYPLQNGMFKLYLPDGELYEEIQIKIPNKPFSYLDRAYKNWRIKKVYSPHNLYYKFLFNKMIPVESIKNSIEYIGRCIRKKK